MRQAQSWSTFPKVKELASSQIGMRMQNPNIHLHTALPGAVHLLEESMLNQPITPRGVACLFHCNSILNLSICLSTPGVLRALVIASPSSCNSHTSLFLSDFVAPACRRGWRQSLIYPRGLCSQVLLGRRLQLMTKAKNSHHSCRDAWKSFFRGAALLDSGSHC